jgi:acetylornithine/N-succinyldiaminopimelate aminotransferase
VSGGSHTPRRYQPQSPDTVFGPFGETAALADTINDATAAVILEPVQGEGGVRIATSEYLAEAERLCRRHGALLIIDEIQTGFCRTGRFFAIQHGESTVAPDIMTMGKGIAGGFPFGGFAISEQVNASIEKGDHGGTYCGNPLGAAVACAVINTLIELKVDERVQHTGLQLLSGLQTLQQRYPALIRAVRGLGLLTALDFADDVLVKQITGDCLAAGLLVTPTRGGIIRLIPGLLVSDEEIRQALAVLDQVLSRFRSQVAAAS